MERNAEYLEVKKIFGRNFIGVEELKTLASTIEFEIPNILPQFTHEIETLKDLASDYILFLSLPRLKDGSAVTILKLLKIFGVDPDKNEPCFYNQDWYLKEDFVKQVPELEWVLLKKKVFENSRAIDPSILESDHLFPKAITGALAFFLYYLAYDDNLWYQDFIWTSDYDHNGDRIYIGKYNDIDGVNKNGFSIHRHLSLRACYASSHKL